MDVAEVLLIDDGELEDVAALLREAGRAFARTSAPGPEELERPHRLLVATGRRALALRFPRGDVGEKPPRRVAVVDATSRTLGATLKRVGFDLLVRRPVHPEALRLLLSHLLHRGPERRILRRVPIGLPIQYRAGLLRHPATLMDLSPGGCRLFFRGRLAQGASVTVFLVDAKGQNFGVRGRVLRTERAATLQPLCDAAISFDTVAADARSRIAGILAQYAEGPARWCGEPPERAGAKPGVAAAAEEAAAPCVDVDPAGVADACGADEAAAEPGATTPDQRRHARRPYEKRVITLGAGGARVVLGRDLSLGGMRIEGEEVPPLGRRLSLALHGGALAQPLVVRARVVRSDGAREAGLVFEEIDDTARDRLSKLLSELPEVETLGDDLEGSDRTVVAEIVDDARETGATSR